MQEIPAANTLDVVWDQLDYLVEHMRQNPGCICPDCILLLEIRFKLLARFR